MRSTDYSTGVTDVTDVTKICFVNSPHVRYSCAHDEYGYGSNISDRNSLCQLLFLLKVDISLTTGDSFIL
jgi:hypothetical protein